MITEIQRVRDFRGALEADDVTLAGLLMAASHASLRDDFEVSCPELDVLAQAAPGLGAIGARLMGAGFGGSTLNLVPQHLTESFTSGIKEVYARETGNACQVLPVKAVDGARAQTLPSAVPLS